MLRDGIRGSADSDQATGRAAAHPLVGHGIFSRRHRAPPRPPRPKPGLREYYDGVLVHSDADVLPLEASWPVTRNTAQLLHYTGFIAAPRRPRTTVRARRRRRNPRHGGRRPGRPQTVRNGGQGGPPGRTIAGGFLSAEQMPPPFSDRLNQRRPVHRYWPSPHGPTIARCWHVAPPRSASAATIPRSTGCRPACPGFSCRSPKKARSSRPFAPLRSQTAFGFESDRRRRTDARKARRRCRSRRPKRPIYGKRTAARRRRALEPDPARLLDEPRMIGQFPARRRRTRAVARRRDCVLPVWWRDDDAIEPTPALDRLHGAVGRSRCAVAPCGHPRTRDAERWRMQPAVGASRLRAATWLAAPKPRAARTRRRPSSARIGR